MNKTKNELKHHSSATVYVVEADFYFEAEMFILSSIENYKVLFKKIPENHEIVTFYEDFYS